MVYRQWEGGQEAVRAGRRGTAHTALRRQTVSVEKKYIFSHESCCEFVNSKFILELYGTNTVLCASHLFENLTILFFTLR